MSVPLDPPPPRPLFCGYVRVLCFGGRASAPWLTECEPDFQTLRREGAGKTGRLCSSTLCGPVHTIVLSVALVGPNAPSMCLERFSLHAKSIRVTKAANLTACAPCSVLCFWPLMTRQRGPCTLLDLAQVLRDPRGGSDDGGVPVRGRRPHRRGEGVFCLFCLYCIGARGGVGAVPFLPRSSLQFVANNF